MPCNEKLSHFNRPSPPLGLLPRGLSSEGWIRRKTSHRPVHREIEGDGEIALQSSPWRGHDCFRARPFVSVFLLLVVVYILVLPS
jgi:hypothetical protein